MNGRRQMVSPIAPLNETPNHFTETRHPHLSSFRNMYLRICRTPVSAWPRHGDERVFRRSAEQVGGKWVVRLCW